MVAAGALGALGGYAMHGGATRQYNQILAQRAYTDRLAAQEARDAALGYPEAKEE